MLDYKLNFFRKRVFPGRGVLLVNDQLGWVFLSSEEYKNFVTGKIDEDLFKKLEDAFIIITPNNEDKIVETQRNLLWHLSSGTSLHILNVTSRCNMNCSYCYANRVHHKAKGFDMTIETAEKVLDFIFQSPADDLVIEFIGGEPLLNFEVIRFVVEEALKRAKSLGKKVNFAFTTNGTNFTEEMAEFFYRRGIAPCFSLDGPKWLHDKNRVYWDGRGTYDDVVYWIKYFRKNYPDLYINALPVITKDSLSHYKEIIDEYINLGLFRFRIKPTTMVRTAYVNWEKLGYSPQDFVKFWENTLNYLLEIYEKSGYRVLDDVTITYLNFIIKRRSIGMTDMEVPCGAIFGQIVYNYNGDIYPCDESRSFKVFKLGSVFTHSYEDIIKSKKSAFLLNAASGLSTLNDASPYYPMCNFCFVHTYATQGSVIPIMKKEPLFMTHHLMIDRLFEKILFEPGFKERVIDWASPGKTSEEKRKFSNTPPLKEVDD